MANRFDTYVRTQYLPSPVDYYQMAMGSQEQEQGAKLQELGAAYDTAFNIDAVFNPDKQLRDELLGNLRNQVQEIAKGNASAPEAQMALKRLVSDRNLVDQLAGIQGNTATYGRLMEEARNYKKEYGNEYNITPITAQMAEYNKKDKTGFQRGFLAGDSVDKYTDVIGEMRKVLKEVGADTSEIEQKEGRWIVKTKQGGVPLEKLMATAGIDMENPLYARQIQNILFHNAYTTGGGDVKKGLERFHKRGLETLDEAIGNYEEQLRLIDRKKPGGEKEFEAVAGELKRMRAERKQTGENKDYEAEYSNRYMHNMALMAATPFVTSQFSRTMKADPYELAEFAHQKALARQKAKLEEMKKILLPPEAPLVEASGSASIINDKRAIAFNQQFGKLEVDNNGLPVIKRANIIPFSSDQESPYSTSKQASQGPYKDTSSEWDQFINFSNSNGFQLDRKAIMDKNNPNHQEEMRKMGAYYKQFQAGASQDQLTSYGIDLGGAGMDSKEVTRYIMQRINNNLDGTVEVVDGVNGNTTKMKLRDVIGSKDSNGKVESINNGDIVATFLPMQNKIAVTYKQGKTFYVDPDAETQAAVAPLVQLYNSPNKIEQVPLDGQSDLVSYSTYDKNFRPVKDVLRTFSPQLNAGDAAKTVNANVGTWAWSEKVMNDLPDNEITVLSRDPRTGSSQKQPYYQYVQGREQDPDYFSKTHMNPVYVLKKKDPVTKKVTFQFVDEHTDNSGNPINAMQMIKDRTGERFKPGASLSGLINRQSPVYHEKFSQFLMNSGFEGAEQVDYGNYGNNESTE